MHVELVSAHISYRCDLGNVRVFVNHGLRKPCPMLELSRYSGDRPRPSRHRRVFVSHIMHGNLSLGTACGRWGCYQSVFACDLMDPFLVG